MTQCTQSSFEFEAHFRRAVVASFEGGALTSDAGALLLRQVDRRLGFLRRLAGCFTDFRSPWLTEHGVEQMLAQRVYGLALGYEDLNDHDQLRHDPLMNVLADKREPDRPLASKSTLCRLERTPAVGAERDRYKKIRYDAQAIDRLLLDVFMEAHREAPEQVVLDLDATDTPLHGRQEGRFFHGFYDEYCYLPLYIFCGDQLLGVRLRQADQDASAGSLTEIQRIVARLRNRWPKLKIILRADSGFCREELMHWCEDNRVDYVFGLARNGRLRRRIAKAMRRAKAQAQRTGRPARIFTEFRYQTRKSWGRARRVVAKAEQIEGKENPRFVVTSLAASAFRPRALYEDLYCARGEMENRIKEQMLLFADRMSAETMRANQLRLYLSAAAYVLVEALRRMALKGTELAQAQVNTIRLRLLKIGARVRWTARRVSVSMASAYPWQSLFAHTWKALRI
ncbi:MAG: IS1380 family transposase [Acidobacteriales bacterium]|nr:MAG: IS1380 family transposase [Terriglobales bacterium]